jgi:tryptophan-rich sensory protein
MLEGPIIIMKLIIMKRENLLKLVASILICQMAGIVGSFFTMPAISGWYATLNKPWFTPPGWFIGVVWLTLFTFMGIALYLVWHKGFARLTLGIFSVQLVLNMLWSFLFFGFQSPLLGLIEIAILWVFIALNIWAFWRIDKRAGYMLLPYIMWVTIAAILNYYVFLLNP